MRAAKSQALLAIACLLTAAACSRRAEDCRNTLTCGNFDTDAGNTNNDSGTPDASVCGAPCSNKTHCDATLKKCVECTSNSNCKAPTTLCEPDAGICIQCTVTNESPCGGNSCNPGTNVCTTTLVNSLKTCEPCVADSECNSSVGMARCIPMNFKGTPIGGYCLRAVSTGCAVPYSVGITATSLSNASSADYCGIDQTATTCNAILDFVAAKTCTNDANCGRGQADALCKTVGTIPNRCTIPCGSGSNCLSTAPGNICTSTTPQYCQ